MALPSGVSKLAVRTVRLLPGSLQRRILPARLGFEPAERFPLPTPDDVPVRLFIGPVNFAGQGWQWARATEAHLDGVDAVSMAYSAAKDFRFPVDQSVPASVYLMSRAWQRAQREGIGDGFTHAIVEAGRHLFGDVYGQTVADEIRWLQSRGIRVAMLTHGSDMRSPRRHFATHAHSPFGEGEWDMTPRLVEEAERNRALLDEVGVPIFVSTPGMLVDVPEGTWLPVVIDVPRWRTDRIPLAGVPLVVHAPSNPVIKGTALVEPVLRRLVAEGLIRYERVEGVPAAQMPEFFSRADIVLDQVRIGDYGVAACEAMAAGRVVLGNVDEQVREHVREATGRDLPIVQADPDTLEVVLRDIVARPEAARAIAEAGVRFVGSVHDGRMSAHVMSGFLGAPATAGPTREDG
jgi:hypothetical protein